MESPKKSKGGDVKKAPPGYYTAKDAAKRLGLNIWTFRYYVKTGKIKRHVPPLRTEGFYDKKEIDRMAAEMALFFHTQEEEAHTETRVARNEDVQGLFDVYDRGMIDPHTREWHRWPTAPTELRTAWYAVNPWIDYVVVLNDEIAGYITGVPYTQKAMQDMLTRRRRAWNMLPQDIRPYQIDLGHTFEYDLYIGIGVRQDRPNPRWLAFRLISGWITFLEELAARGVRIRYMYAVSAEEAGQKLCQSLGFEELAASEEDIFPDPKPWKKYRLDLKTSQSHFARKYRESLKD